MRCTVRPGHPSRTLWNTGDHLLRLTNIDGQFAEKWFAVDTPVLNHVTDAAGVADALAANASAVAVTVTGRNLRSGSTAEWLPSGATEPTLIDAAQVSGISATQATVTFVPGTAKGSAVLTISSPRGIRASRQVTVK